MKPIAEMSEKEFERMRADRAKQIRKHLRSLTPAQLLQYCESVCVQIMLKVTSAGIDYPENLHATDVVEKYLPGKD